MGKIIIAGGNGFIGKNFTSHLLKNKYEPVVLTRGKTTESDCKYVRWDGRTLGDWVNELEGADALLNLAGRSVDCRFTPENKLEILDSRLHSTKILGKAVGELNSPPKLWIQASSVGYYGDTGSVPSTEKSPSGKGFIPAVVVNWEEIFNSFELESTRKVVLRIGMILAENGGALPKLAGFTKMFMGGSTGNGSQHISWLHMDDLINILFSVLKNENYTGSYNCCSPQPVTNKDFMKSLRKVLHKPWSPPVPKFVLKPAAYLLNTSYELAIADSCCIPEKLVNQGYQFKYDKLDVCLKSIFNK